MFSIYTHEKFDSQVTYATEKLPICNLTLSNPRFSMDLLSVVDAIERAGLRKEVVASGHNHLI